MQMTMGMLSLEITVIPQSSAPNPETTRGVVFEHWVTGVGEGSMPADRSSSEQTGQNLPDVQRGPAANAKHKNPPASTGDRRRSNESRILRIAYGLVTVNLWLRTTVLAGFSVALILLAFHWNVMSRPTVPAFLASQLGAGLLVGAVGAAMMQAFIMSGPQTMRKMMNELRSGTRDTSLKRLTDQLTDLSKATNDGIRSLEERLSLLDASLGAHDRHTRMVSGEALSRAGVVNVFATLQDAAAEMSAALRQQNLSEIRLLGLDLSDWFNSRSSANHTDPPGRQLERLLLGEEADAKRLRKLNVRVLLLDPACAAARLLTYGNGGHDSDERLERLRTDIHATAERLSWLSRKIADQQNGNSLQVRFYRMTPGSFTFITNGSSFVRTYYAGLVGPSPAPVWCYDGKSAEHKVECQHFDILWETSSVPCEESLQRKFVGVDQGISESGITNIYTDLDGAQERIKWLISNATERVWIQGVSLSHHLSSPLEEAMLGLLRAKSVDTRLLILDPDSDQAYLKSYRDYLLDEDWSAGGIEYDKYLLDRSLHEQSAIYAQLQYSTRRLMGMSVKAGTGHFQLRHYSCAPTSYVLIADDHALVEQFHYGKPMAASGSIQAHLQLAREMPLMEYETPASVLFGSKPGLDPFAVIENHFTHVFDHFGHTPLGNS
jgi:hypothetical protein